MYYWEITQITKQYVQAAIVFTTIYLHKQKRLEWYIYIYNENKFSLDGGVKINFNVPFTYLSFSSLTAADMY